MCNVSPCWILLSICLESGLSLKALGIISRAPKSSDTTVLYVSLWKGIQQEVVIDKKWFIRIGCCKVHKRASRHCAAQVLSGLHFYSQRKRGDGEMIFVFLEFLSRRHVFIITSSPREGREFYFSLSIWSGQNNGKNIFVALWKKYFQVSVWWGSFIFWKVNFP